MIVSMLAAVALLADAPATAAQTKPAEADPMVCKNEPAPNSRLPKRICATKSEWERRRVDAKENLDRAQTQRPLNGQ